MKKDNKFPIEILELIFLKILKKLNCRKNFYYHLLSKEINNILKKHLNIIKNIKCLIYEKKKNFCYYHDLDIRYLL